MTVIVLSGSGRLRFTRHEPHLSPDLVKAI